VGTSHRYITLTAVDGTPLEGHVTQPDHPKSTAFLITHGVGGNYAAGVPEWFGREAEPYGYATLAINRRDHDENNARTCFEDGLEDLRVAIDYLAREGYSRVFLCGHSKGTIYLHPYVLEYQDPRVRAIGLYGAVHDNALAASETFMLGHYTANVARAMAALREGRGTQRMGFEVLFGPELELTAQGFLSYFGPLSLARPVEAIGKAGVPTLSCWSSSDSFTPERYHLAICEAGRRAGVRVEHVVVQDPEPRREAGAGHNFAGIEAEAMAHTVSFLESL
jgi:pimeloyl-ACP methyl ester carboxylesterase